MSSAARAFPQRACGRSARGYFWDAGGFGFPGVLLRLGLLLRQGFCLLFLEAAQLFVDCQGEVFSFESFVYKCFTIKH